jgi:hypothetical protein
VLFNSFELFHFLSFTAALCCLPPHRPMQIQLLAAASPYFYARNNPALLAA